MVTRHTRFYFSYSVNEKCYYELYKRVKNKTLTWVRTSVIFTRDFLCAETFII